MTISDTQRLVLYETTLHVRDTCLCLAAQRAARALARRFDVALKPTGLNSGQFSLLMSLNRPHPPSISAVANLLAMDRTTLTANIKPLERRGLMQTRINPDDRRGRLLVLTDEGQRALREAVPIWIRTHAEVDRGIVGTTPAKLHEALGSLSGSPE